MDNRLNTMENMLVWFEDEVKDMIENEGRDNKVLYAKLCELHIFLSLAAGAAYDAQEVKK